MWADPHEEFASGIELEEHLDAPLHVIESTDILLSRQGHVMPIICDRLRA